MEGCQKYEASIYFKVKHLEFFAKNIFKSFLQTTEVFCSFFSGSGLLLTLKIFYYFRT